MDRVFGRIRKKGMTGKKQLYVRVLKFMLLSVFAVYTGILTLYTHIHVVEGVTVVHAHIFQQEADGSSGAVPFHSHTPAQYQLIHNLSSLNAGDDVVPCFTFDTPARETVVVYGVPVCGGYAEILPAGLGLRAPPFAG